MHPPRPTAGPPSTSRTDQYASPSRSKRRRLAPTIVAPAAGSVTSPEGKCRQDAGSLWIAKSASASPSTGSSSHRRAVRACRQSVIGSSSLAPQVDLGLPRQPVRAPDLGLALTAFVARGLGLQRRDRARAAVL